MNGGSDSSRKGELGELRSQIGVLAGSRAPGADEMKRELFKKVISYMTVGVDVSSLFSDMVMCSAGNDVVLKKMCYLYVCTYAAMKPELALLTINFLVKDSQDDNPLIRGLALRSLSSLRVRNLLEYLLGPLEKGLKDRGSAYVRSMAVMGVLKLYHLSPSVCKEHGYIDELKESLIRDKDVQVVANSLCALQEIFASEAISQEPDALKAEKDLLRDKALVYSLLNRLRDFSEWQQCTVLDLISFYVPSSSDEVFDIMNILEERLQNANSAIVLSTAKLFLHMTINMPEIHQQVYERLRTPLLTLFLTAPSEVSFSLLSHLHLLISRAPILFSSDYRHFFCRVNEPFHMKKLKLEILTLVADENNMHEIVSELSQYVSAVDVPLARLSIRTIGSIALLCFDIDGVVDRLLEFMEELKGEEFVAEETLLLLKDLLRKYPQWSATCLAVIGTSGLSQLRVKETKAKAALVWLLGEYGQEMMNQHSQVSENGSTANGGGVEEDSVFDTLLEIVEEWRERGEEGVSILAEEVRLELLTAVAKLFFKIPSKRFQLLLGKALSAGIVDSNPDIHDRALLYYRLLQKGGVEVAEKVINPPRQSVGMFSDEQSSDAKDQIFNEFNSLAVIYKKPSHQFLTKDDARKQNELFQSSLFNSSPALPFPAPVPVPSVAKAAETSSASDQLLDLTEKEEGNISSSTSTRKDSVNANGETSLLDFTPSLPPSLSSSPFDLLADLTPLPSNSSGATSATASSTATSAPPAGPASAGTRGTSPLDDLLSLAPPSQSSASDGISPSLAPSLSAESKAGVSAPAASAKGRSIHVSSVDSLTSLMNLANLSAPSPPPSSAPSVTPSPFSSSSRSPSSLPSSSIDSSSHFVLNAKSKLEAPAFQKKWKEMPVAWSGEEKIEPSAFASFHSPPILIRHLALSAIHSIASGGKAPNLKFFLFAQEGISPSHSPTLSASPFFLVELLLNTQTCVAGIKIKADKTERVQEFLSVLKRSLSDFGSL